MGEGVERAERLEGKKEKTEECGIREETQRFVHVSVATQVTAKQFVWTTNLGTVPNTVGLITKGRL